MSYTILTAKYANAARTAAVIATQESGAVAVSQLDRPELWGKLLDWIAAGNTPEPADVPSAAEVATGLAVAIEQANPITHHNQRDFFIAVIAALEGNPLEKNPDGTYKYPGPAKAALVSAEIDAVMGR